MLRRVIPILALAIIILQSCGEYKETESGLRYSLIDEGEGPAPEDGSVVLLDISYLDQNENILFSSSNGGEGPLALSYADSMFQRSGGIEEGIKMIRKGDSLILKFPIEDLYENTFNVALPDTLERGSDVTVCMRATEVFTIEEYQTFRTEQMLIQQEEAMNAAAAQNIIDTGLIDDFLAEGSLDAEVHDSGLRYKIVKEGSGELAQNGQMVHVNYTGRLLNGGIFDTSNEELAKEEGIYNPQRAYEPYAFELGRGGVISGWDIGIGLLNPGSKAILYVPSSLGYGPRQMGPEIPANAILVFDVELVKIGS